MSEKPSFFRRRSDSAYGSDALPCGITHQIGGSYEDVPMGFSRHGSREVSFFSTNNERSEAKVETLTLPPDVDDFVVANGLGDFLKEALAELKKAFEGPVKTRYEVFRDPSDGSVNLYVHVLADDLEFGQRRLSRFSHSWWYDRIATHSHLIGFRIAEDLGD